MMQPLIACIAALGLLLWPALDAQAAKRGGALRVAVEGEALNLDVLGTGFPIKVYRETMGSGLVRVDEGLNIVGDLAQSWELADDGRILTFKLHPGGTYHDGTPLDAASVKWNLDLITGEVAPKWLQELKKKNPQARLNNSFTIYLSHIKRVEVVDKYTLRIHQADIGKAQTLDAMAAVFPRFVLVSPKAYDMDIERFRRHPVLSGPFKFVEWKRNQHLIAERHKGYFDRELPYLDRIEFYFMPDANQRMNSLLAGQVDVINNLPLSLYEAAKKAPGVKVYVGKPTTNYGFPINNQMPTWKKDLRVRQAITCYGVDRTQIVKTAMRGLGEPWVSFSPPGAKDALDLTAECPYDPERAQKLLAEAGHGPNNPLKFTMVINNSDPAHAEVAQLLQSQFAKIGAQMNIQVVDYATWNSAHTQKKLEISLQNTLSFLNVNSNSHVVYSKSGLDYYNIRDPRLDALLEQWRSTMDPQKQVGISHQIQRHIAENAYYGTVGGFPFIQAARADVKGFTYLNKLMNDFRGAWLDR